MVQISFISIFFIVICFFSLKNTQICKTPALEFQNLIHKAEIPSSPINNVFLDKYESTIQFWIKLTRTDDSQQVYFWGNNEFFFFNDRRAVFVIGSNSLYINDQLTYDQWSHFTLVQNNKIMKIYQNGQLQGQINDKKLISFTSNDIFQIGYWTEIYKFALTGNLAEFRIWKIPLTEEQIKANYQQRLSGKEEGLAFYYPMNEGQGQVFKDLVSNNNGDKGTSKWQNVELPINCNKECPKNQFKHGEICVDSCSQYNLIGDQSGHVKVCVKECPTCSVHDTQNNLCISVLKYKLQNYKEGDITHIGGHVYECKKYPESQWCSQLGYSPNTLAGSQAWKKIDHYIVTYCPFKLNKILTWQSKLVYEPEDIIKSEDNKQYYKCKPYPLSIFCSQEAYKPGSLYEVVAWEKIYNLGQVLLKSTTIEESLLQNKDNQNSQITVTQKEWKQDLLISINIIVILLLFVILIVFIKGIKKQQKNQQDLIHQRIISNDFDIRSENK